MANSNNRIKEPDTIHHLVSRIAHRVYFLKDEERDGFVDMMRRTAEFCGIELIGWCIMTNHFHILAYLPKPQQVDEDEILRRYCLLKGQAAASALSMTFDKWRREGELGIRRVKEELDKMRCRMYDIGSFMKILKQWFTFEYNRRYSHKGTLWESAYYDRVIGLSVSKIAECLGYIHLNPIRAAASDSFDGYFWSSYTAFVRGNLLAEKGMRFVYGDDISRDEIICRHNELLNSLLEKEKRRRAEEIARKRAAGYDAPVDPLTSEAMVIQAAAHLEKVRAAAVELHESDDIKGRKEKRRFLMESTVRESIETNPNVSPAQIADMLGVSPRTVYRILAKIRQ
jgi:REP element-mobilizing transposase RayT